ncbi:hypothetical protein Godav_003207 [Gossypium davidsonii]|uniref:Uncharacterized protein n=5 Tax=Gossypium TaxID=3633 RepID=A0A7J8T078_GOSDV|nr:hypothetical protein [Gossypium davidsonii]MBA0666900.1 hypothetical protein [Gossypium klotzschianum]
MLLLKMVINDLDLCYCLRKLWRTVEFLRGGGGSVASKEKLRDDAGSSSRPLFRYPNYLHNYHKNQGKNCETMPDLLLDLCLGNRFSEKKSKLSAERADYQSQRSLIKYCNS